MSVEILLNRLHIHFSLHFCYFSCLKSFYNSSDLNPINDDSTDTEGMYWAVDYPWPVADRDVSFVTCYF